MNLRAAKPSINSKCRVPRAPFAEHRFAGALDFALFRGVRRRYRSRITQIEGVAYGAFIVPA